MTPAAGVEPPATAVAVLPWLAVRTPSVASAPGTGVGVSRLTFGWGVGGSAVGSPWALSYTVTTPSVSSKKM